MSPWRAHLPRPGRRWQVCTGHVLIHVLRYEYLRLILHRLDQHTMERMLAPPAGYGHLNSLIRLDLTASFVHRLSAAYGGSLGGPRGLCPHP